MKFYNEEKNLISILGEQNYDNRKQYRTLKYLLTKEYNNKYYILNLITGTIACLSLEEYLCLSNCQNIHSYETVFLELVKKWFLVPSENNDALLNDNLVNIVRLFMLREPKYINHYTILPTTDCNARCFYCFEANTKRINMTQRTSYETFEFIKNNFQGHKVKIRWFGGEPLYNINAIDIISKNLLDSKIPFVSTMVSNGYLFDDKTILKAKKIWNLKEVQITLDGTEEIYNKVKNYIYNDSKSPYLKVLDNINKLLKAGIFVKIRLNMDSYNADDLKKLSKDLIDRFKGNSRISITIRLLYENASIFKASRTDEIRNDLSNKLFDLRQYFMINGLGPKGALKKGIRLSCCMADDDHSVVITPTGLLSKCEHHLEDELVGTLKTGITEMGIIDSWKKKIIKNEKCNDCPVYPYCNHVKKCPEFGSRGLHEYECKLLIDSYKFALENEILLLN